MTKTKKNKKIPLCGIIQVLNLYKYFLYLLVGVSALLKKKKTKLTYISRINILPRI